MQSIASENVIAPRLGCCGTLILAGYRTRGHCVLCKSALGGMPAARLFPRTASAGTQDKIVLAADPGCTPGRSPEGSDTADKIVPLLPRFFFAPSVNTRT